MSYIKQKPPYALILIAIVLALFFLNQYNELEKTPPEKIRSKKISIGNKHQWAVTNYKKSKKDEIQIDVEEDTFPDNAIKNEVVLRFNSRQEMEDFLEESTNLDFEILDSIKNLNALRIRYSDKGHKDIMLDIAKKYAKDDYNYIVEIPEFPSPRDNDQELVSFDNNALLWLGVPEDTSNWGHGITVAVLDSGISSHPTFEGSAFTNIDLIDDGYSIDDFPSGHGTAVASIIAGNTDSSRGIAPGSNLLGITVMDENGQGNHFTVASGIVEAVEQGAQIINISLGSYSHSGLLLDAINYAIENDVIVVAAAGNDGADQLFYPAAYDGVIGVSAIDANGTYAEFSNSGSGIDIAAPGIGVISAWEEDKLINFTGTSAATPFVSGTLAAILSQNPQISINDALDILYSHADEAGVPGTDDEFGNGILNIERIVNKDTPKIYDVAVADIYIPEKMHFPDDIPGFWVTVQNRGTEWLGNISLEFTQNQSLSVFNVGSLNPGEVFSQYIELNDKLINYQYGDINLSSSVSINGTDDSKPLNNTKTKKYKIVHTE